MARSIVAVILAATAAAQSPTWSDCSAPGSHGKISSVTWDVPPTPGKTSAITVNGTVNETLAAGTTGTVMVKVGGVTVFDQSDFDACKPQTFKLPLNMATIEFPGLKCPLAAGAVTLHATITISNTAPVNSFEFDLTEKDQSGQPAMCINVTQAAPSKLRAAIVDPEWDEFKTKHKKVYTDDADEEARYHLFAASKDRVAKLNKLNGQPAFGTNWMSDRYPQEQHKKGLRKPNGFKPTAPVMEWPLRRSPKSINWRFTEAVTPIKNQGQCGSCWAFSAAEAVESQMILAGGGKFSYALAPQQITSCTPSTGTYGCYGCQGGFTEGAYEYLMTVPGLANSFYIPYEQSLTESTQTVACPTTKVQQINGSLEQLSGGYASVSGYSYAVPPCTSGGCTQQDLAKFATALESTPLSICVNAGAWNDYTGGVMTAAACPADAYYQDHCVMATGFNATAPTPYWIVRNSWASTWGEKGYIYLEMAKNTCGLADDATIPHVKVDLTEAERAEVPAFREAMYQRATRGDTPTSSTVVV